MAIGLWASSGYSIEPTLLQKLEKKAKTSKFKRNSWGRKENGLNIELECVAVGIFKNFCWYFSTDNKKEVASSLLKCYLLKNWLPNRSYLFLCSGSDKILYAIATCLNYLR